jgi:anti-sigma B factor antagonist
VSIEQASDPPLSIQVDHPGGATVVVAVAGELDLVTAPELERALALLPPDALVVLDVAELTFADSVGIHTLVGAVRRIERGGGAASIVCPPTNQVRRVFEIVQLGDIVPLYDNRATAIERLGAGLFPTP